MDALADQWQELLQARGRVTDNPATAAGLFDRGRLEVCMRGDVDRVRELGCTPLVRGVAGGSDKGRGAGL